LNDNNLTSLDPNALDGLTKLTILKLQDNYITQLTAGTFKSSAALRSIDFRNNSIQWLQADTFRFLSSVYSLDLSHNQIPELEDTIFFALTGCMWLTLNDNHLTYIDGAFDSMTSLMWLDLSNNNLSIVDVDVFLPLTQLQELRLFGNELDTFPDLPEDLVFVNATYNNYCGTFPSDLRYNANFSLGYIYRSSSYRLYWNSDCHLAEGNQFFCEGLDDMINTCGVTNATCVESCPMPGPCDIGDSACTPEHTESCQQHVFADDSFSYQCTCLDGYSGELCEEDMNDCVGDPCGMYGACTDTGVNSFNCTCDTGYTGEFCDEDVDDCIGDPCANNATCTDLGLNAFNCSCLSGYNGTLCDQDIDDCAAEPCDVAGTSSCTDLGADLYECKCLPFHSGTWCEVSAPCSFEPCENNGTCTDLSTTTFECACVEGTNGTRCEADVDECASGPCAVNGTDACVDLGLNFYECQCLDGWAGTYCDQCSEGWSGESCDSVQYTVRLNSTEGVDATAILAELQLDYPGLDIIVDITIDAETGTSVLVITFIDIAPVDVPEVVDLTAAAKGIVVGQQIAFEEEQQQQTATTAAATLYPSLLLSALLLLAAATTSA
jgi:hypothetical protein